MINGVGLNGGSSLSGVAGQGGAQRGEAAQRVGAQGAAGQERTSVRTTVDQLAAQGAPVDTDRVSAIKAAIKAGTYRIDPHAIAQKMIATDMGTSL